MTSTNISPSGTISRDPSNAPVSVIGLGAMGSALARALLAAGHPTTVWNRTPDRAAALAARGAAVAASARDALRASPVTILCVLDYDTVDALLEPLHEELRGRAVVNLTSSTPERARRTAAWAGAHGADYLDGAIMVPTPLIGTPDALVLYSGSARAFDAHRTALAALAADSDYLGDDAGLAAIHDLGMLDIFFVGMAGFLHAAALTGADGIRARAFLPYAERIGALLQQTFAELAADVDAGRHPGEQDSLEMELAAVEHIVEASAARGISTAVPDLARSLLREAIARGHGRDGFSRVVDVLREPAAASRFK